MADKLEDLLAGRIKLPTGGPNAKIGPTPEPSKGRWLLEAVTGYPADPLAEMTPLNGIQMLASGLGIAGGLGKWAKVLKGTGGHVGENIAKIDPYGIEPGPQSRRQFFDRMRLGPQKRLKQELGFSHLTKDELDRLAGLEQIDFTGGGDSELGQTLATWQDEEFLGNMGARDDAVGNVLRKAMGIGTKNNTFSAEHPILNKVKQFAPWMHTGRNIERFANPAEAATSPGVVADIFNMLKSEMTKRTRIPK